MPLGMGPFIGAGQREPPLVIAGAQQSGRGAVLNIDVGEATVARLAPAGSRVAEPGPATLAGAAKGAAPGRRRSRRS